jgi:hypothetical protein
VRDPREALAAARRAAASGSAAGPLEAEDGAGAFTASPESARRLAEWAIIEPERAQVYSTRRYGRPITAVKLLLVRLLRQYIGQMSAQQSRFNAQVAAHVLRLEERVAELERAAQPAGERAAQPAEERAAQPAGERAPQPAGERAESRSE